MRPTSSPQPLQSLSTGCGRPIRVRKFGAAVLLASVLLVMSGPARAGAG